MQKGIVLVLAFVLSASVAFADTQPLHEKPQAGPYLKAFGAPRVTDTGSTTPAMQGGMPHADGMSIKKRGVPGLVTSVNPTSFVMTMPGAKGHATSSVTVNVSSSTTFSHASTTAAYTDITPGSHVEVLGTVSTDAKSMTAERVFIRMQIGPRPEPKRNLLERVKDFFTGTHASTTKAMIDARGSAAADMGGGFLGHLLHSLFG